MYELPKVRIAMVKESAILSDSKICSSYDVERLIQNELDCSDREIFSVINLDVRGVPLNWNTVSIGTLDASLVNPREVFKSSILSNAYGIIVAHCHPSGDVSPSQEDIETTKRLKEAGDILGIPVIDHVIVGCVSDGIYSLRKETDIWN